MKRIALWLLVLTLLGCLILSRPGSVVDELVKGVFACSFLLAVLYGVFRLLARFVKWIAGRPTSLKGHAKDLRRDYERRLAALHKTGLDQEEREAAEDQLRREYLHRVSNSL